MTNSASTSEYRTIVVGTDGSASSLRAVDAAARLASATGARLVLACAYEPMKEEDRAEAAEVLRELAYKVEGANPATDALRTARARAVAAGAGEVAERAVRGDPTDVLLDVGKEHDANLIVVGNRGLNSLKGRILGSVPSTITHRAPCDVLVVHTTTGH